MYTNCVAQPICKPNSIFPMIAPTIGPKMIGEHNWIDQHVNSIPEAQTHVHKATKTACSIITLLL